MTTKQRKMQELVESCGGFAEAVQLLQAAFEATFADDTDPPAELSACMTALDALLETAESLDDAVS